MRSRYVVIGGAGFIGSHFVQYLLTRGGAERVTVVDNMSAGRAWHLDPHRNDPRFGFCKLDVREVDGLAEIMAGHQVVIHLASNPDIARAATEPAIDFEVGTLLTHCVVEAARRSGIEEILYASGSGVYGDVGDLEVDEDFGPLVPISTYGASKLAGEALIAAYCYMFSMRGRAFRFANVVGPRQTHGVGFDFVRRLRQDRSRLSILGDGKQSKSYLHVDDVVRAVLVDSEAGDSLFSVFNVATGDYITVTEIAELALECLGLEPSTVRFEYTGGDRGWKGDIPVVRLNCDRIRSLGWRCQRQSREALRDAMESMIQDDIAGLL